MLNTKSTFIQNVSNKKGQVALFVALAFQILFLFFAMVINVGLLVHHKINLQNSADLAAYYGAMKQAENMNAIAHINYQIRQSWKLLTWRYRMLGTAGEFEAHPYNKALKRVDEARASEDLDANPNFRNWQEAPPFCVTYIPFKPMPPGENTCKAVANKTPTMIWTSPPIIATHQAFTTAIRRSSEALRVSLLERCRYFGSFNFLLLSKFVVSFNLDQRDRMELMAMLSRGTSFKTDDFYDLDGQSVKAGIQKTLLNNLTAANRASLAEDKTGGMEIFNSLGADGCNAQGVADSQPAKWLQPIRIYPAFNYVDTVCRSTAIDPKFSELSRNSQPTHKGEVSPEMREEIDGYLDYIGNTVQDLNNNFNFSVGVEKNPWCMAYVGVSVVTKPKIPFSPFGTVSLKARAFYKPFGGRVGPWYYKSWQPGNMWSTGSDGERTDPNLPKRIVEASQFTTYSADRNRISNYSRFPGDPLGLKSKRMIGYYGEAIYNLDDGWRGGAITSNYASQYDGTNAPNFAHWNHLPFEPVAPGGSGDLMAWDSDQDLPSTMRVLENAAILPDIFDLTYYSIDADYYNNYFLRIKNGYAAGPGKGFLRSIRPDLGYHRGRKIGRHDYDKFNILSQYKTVYDRNDVVNIDEVINSKFPFIAEKWMHILTSWAPKSLVDYSLDPDKFGKCKTFPVGGIAQELGKDMGDVHAPQPPAPGNCAVGGTTGYSVKMVSSDYLRSADLKLGGEAAGAGPLRNPPPPESEF